MPALRVNSGTVLHPSSDRRTGSIASVRDDTAPLVDKRAAALPELTRGADIQVNERLSLRRYLCPLSLCPTGQLPPSGTTPGKAVRRSYSAWRLCFELNRCGRTSSRNRELSLQLASTEELDAIWPWALLVLAGVITAAWAIAVGWAAVALVRWLVG